MNLFSLSKRYVGLAPELIKGIIEMPLNILKLSIAVAIKSSWTDKRKPFVDDLGSVYKQMSAIYCDNDNGNADLIGLIVCPGNEIIIKWQSEY